MVGSTSSLSEQAASQIMDMILVERRFKTGDKLPNEMELAEELGISRVTLREAVRILCTRGLVEIKRGRGTFVTSYDLPMPDADLSPLETVSASNRELLEIRMMVEPSAAYYAAKRATPEEARTIRELSQKLEETAAHGKNPVKIEKDFHNAIALAVRRKGKTLKGCIGKLLEYSFSNAVTVDKDIIKAAGVKASKVTFGVPGMGKAKKIIREYYMGK